MCTLRLACAIFADNALVPAHGYATRNSGGLRSEEVRLRLDTSRFHRTECLCSGTFWHTLVPTGAARCVVGPGAVAGAPGSAKSIHLTRARPLNVGHFTVRVGGDQVFGRCDKDGISPGYSLASGVLFGPCCPIYQTAYARPSMAQNDPVAAVPKWS